MASGQATSSREPVPAYSLAPILFPTLPIDDNADRSNPESPAAIQESSQRAIRCSESDGAFLYIGTSNGLIHSFQISSKRAATSTSSSSSSPSISYSLKHTRSLSNHAKPVEKIVLLRPFNAAAVLCEGVVTFFSLPGWSPIRSLPSTRAVSTIVLDDEEAEHGLGTDAAGMISICIVRRKNVVLGKIGAEGRLGLQWATVKEIPLPGGAIFARRFADTLCIANATEYSLVHLSTGQITPLQLPISQTGESPSAQVRPSIVTVPAQQTTGTSPVVDRTAVSATAKCEFLVTSHSGSITLGVFVKPSGEPAPKLLEWPSHPRSVAFDGKYLVSLLRNDTVEVHDLGQDSVNKVQTIQLLPGLDPRFLQSVQGPNQFSGSDESWTTSLSHDDLDFVKVSLSQLSSQDTPVLRRASEHIGAATSSKSQILLCGRNSTSAVQQDPLLSWTVEQLHHGRLRTLRHSLESYRSSRKEHADALRASLEASVAHALLGIELLYRTDFVAAGHVLRHANLDPRLFLALFPSLQEVLQADAEAVLPHIVLSSLGKLKRVDDDRLQSIDEIVDANLALNYSPALDVQTDKTLAQLKGDLLQRSDEMLRALLEEWRTASAATSAAQAEAISTFWAGSSMDEQMVANLNAGVDSAYLTMIAERRGAAESGDAAVEAELTTFLTSEHSCAPEKVEEVLKRKQFCSLLAEHHEHSGNVKAALKIWTGLVDGEMVDSLKETIDVPTALSKVAALLEEQNDPDLLSTYGRWLVRKDPEAGIQILTKQTPMPGSDPSQKSTTRSKAQELEAIQTQKATIDELRGVDADAATKYLEAVALSTSKVQDEQMHRELAVALLHRVDNHLKDDAYRRKMDAVAHEYADGSYAESFFAHLALASDGSSRDIDRLKLTMLLQGSTVLDHQALLDMITPLESLVYEKAIVLGKLGRDSEALSLLAIRLRDANSAEAYCSQDGEVLSPMLATSIAEDHKDLQPFAAMLTRTYSQRIKAHAKAAAQRESSPAQRKEELLKQLLSVYMANGAEEQFRIATAHLLNTQALHLDNREVLELVPKDWSLQTLETFLTQSLRRQLHRRREMQVLRNIAKCRRLDVAEDLWARQRAMGGILQDTELDGGFGAGGDEGAASEGEETAYSDWKQGDAFRPSDVLSSEKTLGQRRRDPTDASKEARIDNVHVGFEMPPSSAVIPGDDDHAVELT